MENEADQVFLVMLVALFIVFVIAIFSLAFIHSKLDAIISELKKPNCEEIKREKITICENKDIEIICPNK